MTRDEKIAKLRELEAKATPGLCEVTYPYGGDKRSNSSLVVDGHEIATVWDVVARKRAHGQENADHLVFLRNNALDIIDELQARVAALEAAADHAINEMPHSGRKATDILKAVLGHE